MAVYSGVLESVSGRRGVTTSGEELIFTGNRRFQAGDSVWTDGKYIYGLQARHGGNMLFGGYYYPFYKLDCEYYNESYYTTTWGMMAKLSPSFSATEITDKIKNTDAYNNNLYSNFFVAGKENSYFGICDSGGYTIYDIANDKKFEIRLDKNNLKGMVLDACVNDDGDLLTAFAYTDNKFANAEGILVYKNKTMIKKIPPCKVGQIGDMSIGTIVLYAHLRKDASVESLMATYELHEYANYQTESVLGDKHNVNIEYIGKNEKTGKIKNEDYKDVDLHFNTKMFSNNFAYQHILHTDVSHSRMFLVDSKNDSYTQVMDIVLTEQWKDWRFVCFSHNDNEYINLSGEAIHKYVDDNDEDYPSKTYRAYRYYDASETRNTFTYSGNINDFSIEINGHDIKCSATWDHGGASSYYHPGMLDSTWKGAMDVLGLSLPINTIRIVDIKETDDGNYLILTSDGLYMSDGEKGEKVCNSFNAWNQNFRVNKVSSSMISKIKSVIGGIK